MRIPNQSPAALLAAVLIATGVATSAHAAAKSDGLVVHRRPFLVNPTVQVGFEAATSETSYTENGVRVSYVGHPQVGGIWTTSQAAEGKQSWYANGGGLGFTRLEFGTDISTFQFAAGSGWPMGQARMRSEETPHLQFRLLRDGVQIAEGSVGSVPLFSGFQVFGFSGLSFDELHLQSQSGDVPFYAGGLDALTLDAIAFGGNVIPEPATWAMMIAGFGFVGLKARRRRALPA